MLVDYKFSIIMERLPPLNIYYLQELQNPKFNYTMQPNGQS